MEELIKLDSIDKYNELFGIETSHPMVSVVDLAKSKKWPSKFKVNYGYYAIFLKNTKCGDITYGRQPYDYNEGTIVCFAPGQVVTTEIPEETKPTACGILFHPDFIRGTTLGREIKKYSFFSYNTNEALHISESERNIVMDCFNKIDAELASDIDRHSKKLVTTIIGLLLDYCMRFYERQFTTRKSFNKDVIVRFELLLDEYFDFKTPSKIGLPTVKYFAEKLYLSPNYFSDMISKQTGKTVSQYIQDKLMNMAKELLISTSDPISEIAYSLGFQYPQHMSRMFKRIVGCTPNEFRIRDTHL